MVVTINRFIIILLLLVELAKDRWCWDDDGGVPIKLVVSGFWHLLDVAAETVLLLLKIRLISMLLFVFRVVKIFRSLLFSEIGISIFNKTNN